MKTILVVDDEPDILDLLIEVLREEGYLTLAARDGMAALELLSRQDVDLVITDTMMPRRGGLELVRSMHEHPNLRHVPAILMSAAGRPEMDRFGVFVFLPKPFDLDTLLDAVAEALQQGHPSGGG